MAGEETGPPPGTARGLSVTTRVTPPTVQCHHTTSHWVLALLSFLFF